MPAEFRACGIQRSVTTHSAAVLKGYSSGSHFYDEMAGADGAIRPHYAKFERLLSQMPLDEFEQKRHAADLAFLRQGITFNV